MNDTLRTLSVALIVIAIMVSGNRIAAAIRRHTNMVLCLKAAELHIDIPAYRRLCKAE